MVFLATKNQKRAKTNSIKNLRLIETRRYMIRSPGSFFCPLKKMIKEIKTIIEKNNESWASSLKRKLSFIIVNKINPEINTRILSNNR